VRRSSQAASAQHYQQQLLSHSLEHTKMLSPVNAKYSVAPSEMMNTIDVMIRLVWKQDLHCRLGPTMQKVAVIIIRLPML
jgi:hypothetical protein